MIDSVSGYRLSVQGDHLVSHLHTLCKYLQNMGVAVLFNEVETITGNSELRRLGSVTSRTTLFSCATWRCRGEIQGDWSAEETDD